MISGLYAAIFALIQLWLTICVVKVRVKDEISLGDGGNDELVRRMRAHGNFVETVGIVILLMLIAELSGAPFWALHILGALMLVGRILHAVGILKDVMRARFIGMNMTAIAFALGAALCLWTSLPALF